MQGFCCFICVFELFERVAEELCRSIQLTSAVYTIHVLNVECSFCRANRYEYTGLKMEF